MAYKEGFEHYLFLKILALAIPKGAQDICDETDKRKEWLSEYSYLLPTSMLLTTFAYVEGMLGESWIEDYGNNFHEELEALRIIRNAITHNEGNIKNNRNARGRDGEVQFIYVNEFVDKLRENSYKPLESWENDKRLNYIQLQESGLVKLGDSSYGRIGSVINNILKRAGKIQLEE